MFAPTRTWRKWHRKLNINQKRYAMASAIAASGVTSLVLARGHQIWNIPEIPLVVADEAVDTLTKTKAALALLTTLKADADVIRCQQGVKRHTGKARLRNRAKSIKCGPLIITGNKSNANKAFRNLAGTQTISVHNLNLMRLAPGGHVGRFIIWTKSAFEALNTVFGTGNKPSEVKSGWFLPRPILANPDIRRVIQSDTIQTLRVQKPKQFRSYERVNFLVNKKAMRRINPYTGYQDKADRAAAKDRALTRIAALKKKEGQKKPSPRKIALSRALNGAKGKVPADKRKKVLPKFAHKPRKYQRIVFGK
jgi:large subunit ribosomal protein L4e